MAAMFNHFTPLLMGRGAVKEIGEKIRADGGTSVLFVHDRALPAEIVDRVASSFAASGLKCTVFCDVEPEVPDSCVYACVDAAQKAGDIDAIVALGGGSTMDCAKIANLLLNNPMPLSQYFIWGSAKTQNSGYPLYLIPTTAGSGDEHMAAAVVCDSENNGRKSPVVSRECFTARFAVIDPELTLSVPKDFTAISGFDAFAHCYESYTGNAALQTPLSDLIALDGMRLVVENLPLAVQHPDHIEYRENMCLAATMSGIATEMARNHAGHALAHALGSTTHAPHGVCVAAVEPFMAEHFTSARYERNRKVLRLFGDDVADGASAQELGRKLREAMLRFLAQIEMPSLKDYGISKASVVACHSIALSDPAMHRIAGADVTAEKLTEMLGNICAAAKISDPT